MTGRTEAGSDPVGMSGELVGVDVGRRVGEVEVVHVAHRHHVEVEVRYRLVQTSRTIEFQVPDAG